MKVAYEAYLSVEIHLIVSEDFPETTSTQYLINRFNNWLRDEIRETENKFNGSVHIVDSHIVLRPEIS